MYKVKSSRNVRWIALTGAALSVSLAEPARLTAAQFTWTGLGGAGNTGWNAPANWLNGSVPANSVNTQVYFPVGGPGSTQNIANPLSLNRLEIGPGVAANIGGSMIGLHSDAADPNPIIRNHSNLASTISTNLSLMSPTIIDGAGTGTLTLAGSLSGGAELDLRPAGPLKISGVNTHTGRTYVSTGTVMLNSNAPFGTGTVSMYAGTTMTALGSSRVVTNPLVFVHTGTFTFAGTNDLTFAGPVSVTAESPKAFHVAPNITTTFGGTMIGIADSLVKEGGGTLVLSGNNNTYTGNFSVNAGTLAIGAHNVLAANSNVSINNGGVLALQGNFGNGDSTTPAKAIHGININGGLMRVPASSGDFWLNQLEFTGGKLDVSGSSLFWMHFTGASPTLRTNASSETATIGGGSLCQIRNNSGSNFVFDVEQGTTPGGIDLDVTTQLVTMGGAWQKWGGGTMRISGTGSNGTLSIESGTLRFDNPDALPTGSINISGGILQYGGAGSFASPKQPRVAAGGWIDIAQPQAFANFTNGLGGNGTIRKVGPGTLALPNLRIAMIRLEEGKVQMTPNGTAAGTSKIESLWIFPGTRMDLTNNTLVTDSTNFNDFDDTLAWVKSGYDNGSWTGEGLMSSSAAANPGHALGIAKATDLFQSFPATFAGQIIDATDVLVRYTRYGDANLDGGVNLADFNRLAANFGTSGKVWSQGDFNFDGAVNLADFNLLAGNFGLAASPGGPSLQDWSNLAAAVPEPSVLSSLSLAGLFLSRRRRARRSSR
jgi:autotransporter-associated beta strand protein